VNKTDLVRGSTDLILLAANNALRAGQKRHDFNLLYGTVDVTVSPTLGTKWSYSDEGTFSETMEYYLIGDTMITDGLPSTLPAGVESGDLLSATITGTGAGIYLYLGHIETPPKVVFCGTYTGVFANPDAEVVYTYRTQGMRKLVGTYLTSTLSPMQPIPWDTQINLAHQQMRHIEAGYVDYGIDTSSSYCEVAGDTVFLKPAPAVDTAMKLTGYMWLAPMVNDADTNFLLKHGFDWLMWQTILEVDHLTKQFVNRQEGNKQEPVQLARSAWNDLVAWDTDLYSERVITFE
tara:strand:- start:1934 stop:2806 length:873 start_codon:yes stop_codon:yes gene_type:complete